MYTCLMIVLYMYVRMYVPTYVYVITLFSFIQCRLDNQQSEAYVTIGTLQEEKDELVKNREDLLQYVRELEQKNDDLERQMRSASVYK